MRKKSENADEFNDVNSINISSIPPLENLSITDGWSGELKAPYSIDVNGSYINRDKSESDNLLNKSHKEFFDEVLEFYFENSVILRENQKAGLSTDQTPINYMAKEFFGDKINYLSKRFNMTHMYKTHAFIDGDKYLESDTVFAVKKSLIRKLEEGFDEENNSKCFFLNFDIVMEGIKKGA